MGAVDCRCADARDPLSRERWRAAGFAVVAAACPGLGGTALPRCRWVVSDADPPVPSARLGRFRGRPSRRCAAGFAVARRSSLSVDLPPAARRRGGI